jgi:hypothetical protein
MPYLLLQILSLYANLLPPAAALHDGKKHIFPPSHEGPFATFTK